jgi:hypothetical protein
MTLDDVEVTEETTYVPTTQKRSPLSPTARRTPSRSSTSSETESGSTSVQRRRIRFVSGGSAREEHHELAGEETGTVPVLPGGITAKHQAVAAEQLTTSEGEERQRIVVKAVRDPRPASDQNSNGALGPGRLTMEVGEIVVCGRAWNRKLSAVVIAQRPARRVGVTRSALR